VPSAVPERGSLVRRFLIIEVLGVGGMGVVLSASIRSSTGGWR
jgi:hypothetical protein